MEKLTDNNIAFCIENNCYMEMSMDELRLNLSKAPTFEELYTKLNKYEQLEQELGCPLDIFIKSLKYGIYQEDGGRRKLPSISYNSATEKFYFDFGTYCNVDEYGKAWWLKEDKSE